MKRIIALLLTVVLCLCLAACGKAPEPEQSPQEPHTEATNTEAEKPQSGSSSPGGNEAEKPEAPVQRGGGGAEQGVSPQPAAPVRPVLLPGLPGCGEAGGCAGTQQHRDHPHLPDLHRGGARADIGAAGPGHLIKDKINLLPVNLRRMRQYKALAVKKSFCIIT